MATRSNGERDEFTRNWDAAAAGLAALFAVVVAVRLWASVVSRATQPLVFDAPTGVPARLLLGSAITVIAGIGLGSVAYVRYRGLGLALSPPRHDGWAAAVAAVLAPVALALGAAVVGNFAFEVSLSAMVQRWTSPNVTATFLILTLLPAVTLGGGYGLLFFGVVGERVRQLLGPDRAVAVTTALVGFFWLLPVGSLGRFRLDAGFAVETGLSLLFGAAFGASIALAYRLVDGGASAGLRYRDALAFVTAAVGVVGVASGFTALPRVAGDLLWVAVFGIAAVGYERTRSLWVPMLAIAAFQLAVGVVVYAESVLGLATL